MKWGILAEIFIIRIKKFGDNSSIRKLMFYNRLVRGMIPTVPLLTLYIL